MGVAAKVRVSRGCGRDGAALQYGLVTCLVGAAVLGAQAMTGNFIGDLLSPVTQALESVVYAVLW